MSRHELEFRFPKGLSFFTKLKLKALCKNTDLDAPGYRGIIALASKVEEEYKLHVTLSFITGSTLFSFRA